MSDCTYRLFSDGLLSKWGFGDGEAPELWLDWCDKHDINYGDWRGKILPGLVRRYLLTALDQQVTVVEIRTNHNPIRAETVNGTYVSDCWCDSHCTLHLTPEYVEVTIEQILEVALGVRMSLPIDPVRLCCGQRHSTVQCPDGLVWCCICFGRFPVDQLNRTYDGIPENVCVNCAADEARIMAILRGEDPTV